MPPPARYPRLALAALPTERRTVVILLRGALDGLAAVPPYGDPDYARQRGTIALTATDLIPIDSMFGLNPGLQSLKPMWDARELLILHAVASPYRERSHFDGQSLLENGTPRPQGSADGWLNRALGAAPLAARWTAARARGRRRGAAADARRHPGGVVGAAGDAAGRPAFPRPAGRDVSA
ncbi:MAG: hypothetical protein WDO24_02775 [Pseudomonadota bacterium]